MMDAAALHASLLTLDTHIDIPWPTGPNFFDDSPRDDTGRRVDAPKMAAGQLRAGCFAAYVPQGPRTTDGWHSASSRALAMLDAIGALGRDGLTRVATSADAIEAAYRDGVIAIVPVVENGHAIGEDLGLLAAFRAKGVVYMTMTHNGHNALADSSNPRKDLGDAETLHGGLSPLGRDAVQEMNRLGMMVDISHVSAQAALQAAMLSKTPVLATHSCIRALCDVPRNVDDMMLDALRDCGGMVNITAVPSFVRAGAKAAAVTVGDYCDHVDYVVKRCGLAHVGISSDFDGGGGFTGWRDASESGALTAELVRRGYDAAEIAALWGGNFLRLLRVAEDAARA
ncbi:MAG: membrane dipeptidase [Gemmatimonadaceae bacterium]|nr:membrane dipeptidase [Acetobacteraceae bacterium]